MHGSDGLPGPCPDRSSANSDHYVRLRADGPVHFNEIESAGRYWSIMDYDDVRAIDGDWENFSSASARPQRPMLRRNVEWAQEDSNL